MTRRDEEFQHAADPYRGELLAHCYRMLGSVHEAEDLVQETYLNAWRGYSSFEGRSSIRTWLHRIATNACLSALEGRERRPLPIGLGPANADPEMAPVEQADVPWLEPIPDSSVDPASIVTSRESIRLAFIAALQHLPARQRAVLVLRDVLKLRAAEVADMLDTTTAAVNSALQRAHAHLATVAPSRDTVAEPTSAQQRELLDRFVVAFEAKDIPAIVEVFAEDAVMQMPPFAGWYRGARDIARLVGKWCPGGPDDLRLLPVNGNGQPGFATYIRASVIGRTGSFVPWKLELLELTGAGVRHSTSFFDTRLFRVFGLPCCVR
ncbi:sigma-70 family RNA polymerase sigma factor [Kibdelosporangium persicum]|uniref:RNA polymerase sigma factor n=1 Tax=Kibdelosporangium persicum TaxID=2698649 RepID=A0ABX2F242_9PSEU|nr:sigma-70 family RNA polymerase sigma factor [Kibdelosporangium persicum]NRN65367.1 RNA polymerase ECF-type sigma factor SigG [Kibdelosporangium persicum]